MPPPILTPGDLVLRTPANLGFERVLDKHGSGHRPDPARVRGQPPRPLADAGAKVTHLPPVRPVGAHVDDGRAGLDHVLGDQVHLSGGRDQDVRIPCVARQIPGPGVTHGDRCVSLQKQKRGRLTDEIASTDNDRLSALNLNARAVEQLDDAGGGAWLYATREPACETSSKICLATALPSRTRAVTG